MKLMTRSINGGLLTTVAGAALLAVTMSVTSGCRMPGEARAQPAGLAAQQVDFWVEPSRRTVLAGETVTLTVRDQDTAGRDVNIEWSATGGEITTERNNRIARIQFDTPGVYTITGRMYADDMVMTDSVDITVQRVR
jgi:plastocyanin